MVTLFGTDGVRGVVNSTLMPELAFQLGGRQAPISVGRKEPIACLSVWIQGFQEPWWQPLYRRGCARRG